MKVVLSMYIMTESFVLSCRTRNFQGKQNKQRAVEARDLTLLTLLSCWVNAIIGICTSGDVILCCRNDNESMNGSFSLLTSTIN